MKRIAQTAFGAIWASVALAGTSIAQTTIAPVTLAPATVPLALGPAPVALPLVLAPPSGQQPCQPIFTKTGMSTAHCTAQPAVSAPLTLGPVAPVAVTPPAPVESAEVVDTPVVQPIDTGLAGLATTDFAEFGIGGGLGLLGSSFSGNGAGGAGASDTFGGNLAVGELMYGVSASGGARFLGGNAFVRGNGVYAFGTDSWTVEPSADYANPGSVSEDGTYGLGSANGATTAFDGNAIRAGLSGGYTFDLGEAGIGIDVGPAVSYVSSNYTLALTDAVTGGKIVDETVSTNATYLGATAGISFRPDWRNNFGVWGHVAGQAYYGFGSGTGTQVFNSALAGGVISGSDATGTYSGTDLTFTRTQEVTGFTFGGEAAINAGYRIGDNILIGAGAYVSYLNDVPYITRSTAVGTPYVGGTTSLLDFGLRAGVAVGF